MNFLHVLFALLVVAIWGVNFSVIKIGLRDFPPLFLNGARYFLACVPWIFFLKKPNVPFKWIALYGVFMFALAFSLLFLGISFGVASGLASLLYQTQVFFTLFFAVAVFKEKLHPIQIIGACVAFSGIVLAGVKVGGGLTLGGFFLILMGAASWGAGNAISKKIGYTNMVALVSWGSLVAWPLILAASLIFEGPQAIWASLSHPSLASLGALAYIAYASTMVGFGLWSWLIHHHPLSSVAPFALLVPVFGMGSSILLLGEPLQKWKVEAFVLIVMGLSLHLLGPRIASFIRKKFT